MAESAVGVGLSGVAPSTESEQAAALESFPDPVFIMEPLGDAQGRTVDLMITYANAAAARFYGRTVPEIVGHAQCELYPSVRDLGILAAYLEVLDSGVTARIDVPWFSEDNIEGAFRVTVSRFGDGLLVVPQDITAQRRAEAALRDEVAQFGLAMDNSSTGMCLVSPHGRFLRVNPAMCELLGRSAEEMGQLSWGDITHPDDLEKSLELVNDLLAGRLSSFRTLKRYIAADGRVIWGDVSVAAVPNADGTVHHEIAQILDVSDRVETERALTHLATHDPLTGLANRAAMLDEITRSLSAGQRSGLWTGVLMMDLDNFKDVNDSLGHGVGDEILQAAAKRIEAVVRAGDLAARPGGDEFVLVMREMREPAEAVRAAWRLVQAFREPFIARGAELHATASVGVAIASGHSEADDLLREADTAMYIAKAEGRDRIAVFNEDLRAAVAARAAVEADLGDALGNGELAVWYQPEIDLASGAVITVEALLRWHHPSGETYAADRFVEVAEETGLILDLGDWVLRQACLQAAEWARARPDRPAKLRVNVSSFQLGQARLIAAVDAALAASGLAPGLLCMEVAESALAHETSMLRENLAAIKERGIGVAVDRFGGGHASLDFLRRYPVDGLRIDRSLVKDITTDSRDRRLVAGIVALGCQLDVTVTAEGVESREQAELLLELGCPGAQGYQFSEVVPPEQVVGLLGVTYALG